MRNVILRVILRSTPFLAITILPLLLSLPGCGGTQAEFVSPGSGIAQPAPVSLEHAVGEIRNAPLPDNVDQKLFNELREELLRVVLECNRNTSIAPTGDHNAVDDLVLLGNDSEGWRLEWTCRNTGDYDRNGEVGLSDLSQIARYFQNTKWSIDWSAGIHADGDLNGEVNLGDVTPLAVNFMSAVAGYRILGTQTEGGAETLLGEVVLPVSPQSGAWLVSYDLPANDYSVYRVEPIDAGGIIGTSSGVNLEAGTAAVVSMGTDTIQDTQTIGTAGGEIVGGVGTPLEDISIRFAEDSLFDDESINLGWNDGSITPVDGVFVEPIIEFGGAGVAGFFQPIEITVPITGGDEYVPVLYDIAEDGSLSPMRFEEIDYVGGTATFSSFHASPKAVINAPAHFTSLEEIGKIDTGFRPGLDDFQIRNLGSSWNMYGECLGMVAFASWYYTTGSYRSHGRLFPSFQEQLGWQRHAPGAPPLLVQDVIATRAQTSTHYMFINGFNSISQQRRKLSPIRNFAMMRGALMETRKPIFLGLYSPEISVGHVVLAYAMQPDLEQLGTDGIVFKVYDPSFPGVASSIFFLKDPAEPDWNEAVFNVYTGPADYNFDSVVLDGQGSMATHEPFESILEDALADPPFGGEAEATITVDSHSNEEEVSSLEQTFSGSVQDSELWIEAISCMPRSTWVQYENEMPDAQNLKDSFVELYDTDSFSVPIELFPGENNILFLPLGIDMLGNIASPDYRILGPGFPEDNQYDDFILEAPLNLPEVTITSHTDGQDVFGETVTIVGTINSPDINIAGIELFIDQPEDDYWPDYNSLKYDHKYNVWGATYYEGGVCETVTAFSITVPTSELTIRDGKTHLYFTTYGQYNRMEEGPVDIDTEMLENNYTYSPFTLAVHSDPGQLSISIDWEAESQADFDAVDPVKIYHRDYVMSPYVAWDALFEGGSHGSVGYGNPPDVGSLGAEPFALWSEQRTTDTHGNPVSGTITVIIGELVNPARYRISHRRDAGWPIRVTQIRVSGELNTTVNFSEDNSYYGAGTWDPLKWDTETGIFTQTAPQTTFQWEYNFPYCD